MHRGFVKMWRKMEDSAVFADPALFHTWCSCLFMANWKEAWVKIDGLSHPVQVLPGQFITGRSSFYKACYPKKRKGNPSEKTLWRWLTTLADMQNLTITSSNKFSLITITNWELYQGNGIENVQQDDPHVSSMCPASDPQVSTTKNLQEGEEEKRLGVFFGLLARYPNHQLLDQAFKAIASTRKSGKVADNVLLSQLQKWDSYPVEQVEAGIRVYLEKRFASQGKDEAYLYGIIRKNHQQTPTGPEESTGSPTLDRYYAGIGR